MPSVCLQHPSSLQALGHLGHYGKWDWAPLALILAQMESSTQQHKSASRAAWGGFHAKAPQRVCEVPRFGVCLVCFCPPLVLSAGGAEEQRELCAGGAGIGFPLSAAFLEVMFQVS